MREKKAKAKAEKEHKSKAMKTKKGTVTEQKRDTSFSLFCLDMSKHPAVVEYSPGADVDFELPGLRRNSEDMQKVANMSPAKLNILDFKAGFGKSEASRDCKGLAKAEALRSQLLGQFGPKEEQRILEHEPLLTDFVWARKKGCDICNIESNGMGSLRCVTRERACINVIMAPFSKLRAVASEESGLETPGSNDIRNMLADLTQERLDGWASGGKANLYHCHLVEGDVLNIPPGWVVAEHTTSSTAFGMSVSWLTKSTGAKQNLMNIEKVLSNLSLNSQPLKVYEFLKRAVASLPAAPTTPATEHVAAADALVCADSLAAVAPDPCESEPAAAAGPCAPAAPDPTQAGEVEVEGAGGKGDVS